MSNYKTHGKETEGKKPVRRNRKSGTKAKVSKEARNDVGSNSTDYVNNPNWYYTDAGIADDMSRMSFNNFQGDSIKLGSIALTNPSIFVFDMLPSPGTTSVSNGSALLTNGTNLAAIKLFSELSMKSGRTTSYAPQDVAMLELAIGEVLSMISFCRRAFGIAFSYNQRNRDYPRHIISSMGINVDDFLSHLPEYRMRLNTIITAFNQVPFPSNVAYLDKCASLYDNIYLDSPSAMAQSILMRPLRTWILDETSYEGGTILKTVSPFTYPGNADTHDPVAFYIVLNCLQAQVEQLLDSGTLNYIYGDILNLSQKNSIPLLTLAFVPEAYSIMPVYNEKFLLQMHNMTIARYPVMDPKSIDSSCTPSNDVYPDTNKNAIRYKPCLPLNQQSAGSSIQISDIDKFFNNTIIDSNNGDPSIEDRIEMTRYKIMNDPSTAILYDNTTHVQYCAYPILPDHYCAGLNVFGISWNTHQFGKLSFITSSFMTPDISRYFAIYISKLDWAPLLQLYNGEDGAIFQTGSLGDLDYYTVINSDYLKRVNLLAQTALMQLR